jgi:D-beta-D-heptose 7-phosphate kinase/D-beta-D-heptose 1-phosphate adenosyltransferase
MVAPPLTQALARHIGSFAERSILVIGDVMLDRYVAGEVRRISPEAPIPVLRATPGGAHGIAGGAGNVARNVASLGGRVIIVGVVGQDAAGDELVDLLGDDHAIMPLLVRAAGRPTTVKTRFTAAGHQLLRLDEEDSAPFDAATEARLLATIRSAMGGAEMVVLSDYAKGVLSDAVLAGTIEAARETGKRVIADPKRERFEAYRGVFLLTPNVREVSRATGMAAGDDAAAAAAGQAALAQSGAEAVLVTRSEKGMTLVTADGTAMHIQARAQAVADVSGAGDTVAATLAVALAAGASLAEAAGLANAAASVVVGKPGAATVNTAELIEALHLTDLHATGSKIVGEAEMLSRVARWKMEGLLVGFTNGCFDLIHPGHVHLLARARAECDRLVVALNTDASVRRLKGEGRPVQSEAARATVMAAMAAADLVVLFDDDTPARIIGDVMPDVLVKGADYTVEQVVGADTVLAAGGRVVLVPLEQGQSTTATIRRIGGG